MADVVLAAGTVIALDACAALDAVLALAMNYVIGGITLGECGPLIGDRLDPYLKTGKLRKAGPAESKVLVVLSLAERYRLGDGETESLAIALAVGAGMATDDRTVGRAVAQELGGQRLTGTAELLRQAVREGIVPAQSARIMYGCMKTLGAFIPDVPSSYFQTCAWKILMVRVNVLV